jgi:hypothetical protein
MIIVALWAWIDIEIKKMQPYIDLVHGDSPPQKSLLLDYTRTKCVPAVHVPRPNIEFICNKQFHRLDIRFLEWSLSGGNCYAACSARTSLSTPCSSYVYLQGHVPAISQSVTQLLCQPSKV